MQKRPYDTVKKSKQLLTGILLLLFGVGAAFGTYEEWKKSQKCSAKTLGQFNPEYRIKRGTSYVTYSFSVDGKRYSGKDEIEFDEPKDLSVIVRYDPADPSHNEIQSKPHWAFLLPVVGFLIGGVVFLVLGASKR
jgi:hypothetical protein